MRQSWVPTDQTAWWGVAVGGLAAGATILFLFVAVRALAVASVLSSLYPAFTVLLAAVILREPIHRAQSVGLAMALAAVALVAAG